MIRAISLAVFTIVALSKSRFWCLWTQACSSSTDHNLQPNGLRSGLEEDKLSALVKSGTRSCNHFRIFLHCERVQNPVVHHSSLFTNTIRLYSTCLVISTVHLNNSKTKCRELFLSKVEIKFFFNQTRVSPFLVGVI